MAVKCLTGAQKDDIATFFQTHEVTQDYVATLYGISRRTVQRLLIEKGVLPSRAAREVGEGEIELLKVAKDAGITAKGLRQLIFQMPGGNDMEMLSILRSHDYSPTTLKKALEPGTESAAPALGTDNMEMLMVLQGYGFNPTTLKRALKAPALTDQNVRAYLAQMDPDKLAQLAYNIALVKAAEAAAKERQQTHQAQEAANG